ncbi:agamous-like MADS-box protein AGL80 [Vigna umbellata]|uniref:agamous-like MADS-box protein AGL80 n=1 Tax=Vigna umbellata TaxID=87088 RepID=UPI001F5E4722|nr:agamous-like MADS-box protein AGL80 [Vigna umbellata]
MTRAKIELAYITDPAKRKATFKKRKNGLMKKISEITVLCGIDACAVVYSPDLPNKPEVWPSESEARSVISKFNGVPEAEKRKKMFCQESFLRQRIDKGKEQLKKLKNENRKREINLLMCEYLTHGGNNLDSNNMSYLKDFSFFTDQNLDEIRNKITMLQTQEETPETMDQGEQAQVHVPKTNFSRKIIKKLN